MSGSSTLYLFLSCLWPISISLSREMNFSLLTHTSARSSSIRRQARHAHLMFRQVFAPFSLFKHKSSSFSLVEECAPCLRRPDDDLQHRGGGRNGRAEYQVSQEGAASGSRRLARAVGLRSPLAAHRPPPIARQPGLAPVGTNQRARADCRSRCEISASCEPVARGVRAMLQWPSIGHRRRWSLNSRHKWRCLRWMESNKAKRNCCKLQDASPH